MKNFTPYLLALSLSIIFASCSSNEAEVIENNPENLLQSYTLKRDATGAYSIDFNTTNNTDVTTVTNVDNSKEIILAETPQKTATKHSNDFSIENDHLKIGFLEANNGKRKSIYVEDENITFAKGITEFLNSYSITANEDGTYQLNFVVNDNVNTDFIYNEKIEAYEVHLSNGNALQKVFSRQLEVGPNETLKINFVNYKNTSSKSDTETYVSVEEKPVIVIS
ncbi:hypothetical protein [Tenacibaculum singaporense]|uniref:hypothetical protein n=1 Tax=Tenacibaculum singaporense TaxID=2358479 RepID=UPI000F66A09F|nr:hypothetical protein [Tenacibaculum singaporense]RSC93522.1 hypothetical protein EI424_09960 [Tenacibaculum singaporense]